MSETHLIAIANIRAELARRDMSQADLAERVGLTRQSIHRITSGKARITIDLLDRIAHALRVSPTTLLRRAA